MRSPQVVIAHPDPLEADRLRMAFQQAGYEVDCVPTAQAAVETWRALQPEVVIVYQRLPDGSAGEVLAAVSAPGSPTVAIAIVDDASTGEALTFTPRRRRHRVRARPSRPA
jgi:DNA-binding response OmpR family regulator